MELFCGAIMVEKSGVRRGLRKKQLAVIEEMFTGELDEAAILAKHDVSRVVYNKWQNDERFTEEFDRRIISAHRQGEVLIARYATLAAAKLIRLIESDKEEVARRACLDIISRVKAGGEKMQAAVKGKNGAERKKRAINGRTASRLLKVLAEEKRQGQNKD